VSFADRLAEVRRRISAACARAGRNPSEVRVLAVSKLQPLELIEEAYALGLRDFGENYTQELAEKRSKLSRLRDARWHLIGHLQSNKAKLALENADSFQALDGERLLREITRRAATLGRREPWRVFIQVNLDGEESKAGIAPSELDELARATRAEPAVSLAGLMCIPRPRESAEAMRPAFRELARLARGLSAPGQPPLELSMGMSEDFEIAIEEGASWVRIGRLLFGARPS
jgi:pyridoxal phosphate enzyme (YggS family)